MYRRPKFTMKDDWVVLAWVVFMHVGALAAFFTFSWKALGVCLFLWWLTGGVGICLGYHRYFTHRSYATYKPVEYFLAVCGCMAGESGPMAWVAAHRYHHTNSDLERDPHSPLRGFFWAHMGWLFGREKMLVTHDEYKRLVPDMAKDRFLVFLDKFHILPSIILSVVLLVTGGWPFLVWGLFVRSVVVYHSTWLVNSAAHVWGYRTYKTTDVSTNNWWVALLSFGEGWHNNHHAFQRSARHGMRWWELDLTYRTIQLLWVFGLATQIHLPAKVAAKSKESWLKKNMPQIPQGLTIPVIDFDPQRLILQQTAANES